MIRAWTELSVHEQEAALPRIRDIFFQSSARRSFDSDEDKEKFWAQWTGYYFEHEPQLILLSMENEKVAGYIMGCANSRRAQEPLTKGNLAYMLFDDQFDVFPAHLHINLGEEFRGQGLGRTLLEELVRRLTALNCSGLHLVTSPSARNVGFYKKNGFDFALTRTWQGRPLLFMGRHFRS